MVALEMVEAAKIVLIRAGQGSLLESRLVGSHTCLSGSLVEYSTTALGLSKADSLNFERLEHLGIKVGSRLAGLLEVLAITKQ